MKKVEAAQSIPFGYKIAIARIGRKELVLKYGEVIGEATDPSRRANTFTGRFR